VPACPAKPRPLETSPGFPCSPRATAARSPLAYKYCSPHQQQRGEEGFFRDQALLKLKREGSFEKKESYCERLGREETR